LSPSLTEHPLKGLTGMVIRIDREIPNKPILEVQMDRDGRVVYLPFYQKGELDKVRACVCFLSTACRRGTYIPSPRPPHAQAHMESEAPGPDLLALHPLTLPPHRPRSRPSPP
jgi:hypothetical protein